MLILNLCLLLPTSAPAADRVDYRKDVKPVLRERCYACHGALAQKAKLRVDSGANLLRGGAVVPGKPDESDLIRRVAAADAAERMPPEGHALKPEQVAAMRAWVAQGAAVPADDTQETDPRDHWSFRAPRRPAVPAVDDSKADIRNEIDRFVAIERQKRGLTPVGPADKRLLLRRVFIDLIGLPPTAEQYETFLNDPTPDAYEKAVDRLLASPEYGERWGRHFLDIWRYSDWWGLGAELRNSQRHIWHWRDWTVESFIADLGYDAMIRQMLAADELYPTDADKLRATGYLARPYFLFNRTTWLDEVVEHTGKGFLGVTFNCAKCHDHKYDPVSQTNYYQFRAIFEPYQVRTDLLPGETDALKDGIPRAYDANPDAKTPFHIRGDERNPEKDRAVPPGLPQFLAPNGFAPVTVKLPPAAYRPGTRPEIVADVKRATKAKLAAAKTALTAAEYAGAVRPAPELTDALLAAAEKTVAAAQAEAAAVEARAEADATTAKGDARAAATAEKYLAVRAAELAAARAAVELVKAPADPKAVPARKATEAAVAAAKKAAEAPGETYSPIPGAVKSAQSNIDTGGKTGPFPDRSTGRRTALANSIADRDNPLTARVAVNHVWLRHFGAPLVANVFEFGRKGSPPSHSDLLDWLAVEFAETGWSFKHLHRLIVTSGTYRLSSSAACNGAAAKIDPENRYLWRMNPTRLDANAVRDALLHLSGDLESKVGGPPVPVAGQDASRRRSLYFFHSHNEHNALLDTFDNANVLECYRRSESIVPQQALALWNGRLAQTAAAKITARLIAKPGADGDAAFVADAFLAVLGTPPSEAETAACLAAITDLRATLKDVKGPEQDRRVRLQVVQALINHNDFVTVR